VLNDVFVAGLPGLVPVYQQWSEVTFSSVRACFGLPLPCLLSVLSASRIFFSKLLNAHLLHLISAISASSLREPYSLYWCKLVINASPSLLNGMLRYWYFNISHKNCLQTPKVYLKLNVIENCFIASRALSFSDPYNHFTYLSVLLSLCHSFYHSVCPQLRS